MPGRIAPSHLQMHEFAPAKIEALSIVLIKERGPIGAGKDGESQGPIDLLGRVLPQGSHGDHRARPNVKRERSQVHFARYLSTAIVHIVFQLAY